VILLFLQALKGPLPKTSISYCKNGNAPPPRGFR